MFLQRCLIACLILCNMVTQMRAQTASAITATSAQLNAIAKHSETVYFVGGAALRSRAERHIFFRTPLGVLSYGMRRLPLKNEFFDEALENVNERLEYVLIGAKEFQ